MNVFCVFNKITNEIEKIFDTREKAQLYCLDNYGAWIIKIKEME